MVRKIPLLGLLLSLVTLMPVQAQISQQLIDLYGGYMRIAARAGDANYVESVLAYGIPPDVADVNGLTALHWAGRFGRVSVTIVLLQYGANKDATTKTGETPLMSAAMGGSLNVTKLLLSGEGNTTRIDDQEQQGYTALILAARLGFQDIAEFLISRGADITLRTVDAQDALFWAAYAGHFGIVKLLVEAGADINTQDDEGNTPLIWASRNGFLDIVKYLIQKGADVNLTSKTGDSALMWAAYYNYLEIAKVLLDNGIGINLQDENGWTALMGAAAQGNDEMVDLLLSYQATVAMENNFGHTALTIAAAVGTASVSDLISDEMLELMNQQDNKGYTPFIHAAANNLTTVFLVLAYKCPNISKMDHEGKTAMDFAQGVGNQRMIDMLDRMADPKCYRFGVRHNEGETIYQDCELLQCHCTGAWRYTFEKDPECGKGKSRVITLQRSQQGNKTKRLVSYVVK